MTNILNDDALNTLFRDARTFTHWQDRPVSTVLLQAVYDLFRMGPTSANSCPARIVFVTSADAKETLKPALNKGNVRQTMEAPVTAIIGYDTRFYEKLGQLFPHSPDARSWFEGKPDAIAENAFRNGTLQGAYLIIAARALGLDCGPMSGFSKAKVDAAFFPDGRVKSNFLCNIGYGDRASLHPRNPRLPFDEACRVV
jgi:3-hydroxypropanoate dehydrogenase